MPTTPYRGYELYSDTAAPDLSESGEYNKAINAIDADMHEEIKTRTEADAALSGRIDAEVSDRKAADSALDAKIAKEVADRGSADTALSGRIDNAEAEISANSADLTGIKGLTYGEQHVNFLESSNGEYSSPALEEIAEQMGQNVTYVETPSSTTTLSTDALARLIADWPHVVLIEEDDGRQNMLFPARYDGSKYTLAPLEGHYSLEGAPYATGVRIDKAGHMTPFDIANDPYWSTVSGKPFSNIGLGLKVVADALTVDTTAIPAGITANTTFGVLETALLQ